MFARIQSQYNEEFPALASGLLPVLMAIALLVASRTSVCIVIAAEQDYVSSAQTADDGQSPDAIRQEPSESESTDRRSLDFQVTEEANGEISGEIDLSKLETTVKETSQGDDRVRILSVEPGSEPILPTDRPAWVGSQPDLSSKQHRVFVGSSPEITVEATEQSLDIAIEVALQEYVDEHVLNEFGAAARLPISADFARKNLLEDPAGYMAELKTSDGPMFQKWIILLISPEQREQFKVWHVEAIQRQRLGKIGFGLLVLLGGTGSAHLFLSRRNRHSNPRQREVDLPPILPASPQRSRGVLRTVVLTGCLLAVAVPAVYVLRHKSQRDRVSVEVKHESSQMNDSRSERKAKIRHSRHSERDS